MNCHCHMSLKSQNHFATNAQVMEVLTSCVLSLSNAMTVMAPTYISRFSCDISSRNALVTSLVR